MKKTALVFLVIAVIAGGCKGRFSKAPKTTQTETMAPAAPATTPETSDPMTQTVDVEDSSRSVAEGGVDTIASDTATAAKKKTGAAATSRRTPSSKSRPHGRTQ